ncbi:MAG: HAD family hydrolase, partial [Bacteroidales bacterium]|nr:HAD family hydrolase [Bacteroidales bacterium]
MFSDVKTIFIDLDDTIWDFTANSKVAMRMVYTRLGLDRQCPYERFIVSYLAHNERLWNLYHHGEITKDFLLSERFRVVFEECGIAFADPEMPRRINDDYLETIVTLDRVVDGAPELLEHLKRRGPVYVLSNGFANLQSRKLRSGHLDGYIDRLVLSDDIGITKPDRRL